MGELIQRAPTLTKEVRQGTYKSDKEKDVRLRKHSKTRRTLVAQEELELFLGM